MANFQLILEYDGTAYSGWQRQKADPSIQETVETALERMIGVQVRLIGSGRTDAGVHALGQVANFRTDAAIPPEAFLRGLNGLLPADIRIRHCRVVEESFHSRFDAVGKVYRYRILNRETAAAVGRHYAWHVRKPLNADAMGRAAAALVGTYDFKAFEGAGSPRRDTVRTVWRAEVKRSGEHRLDFEIEGNGFLRHMVRNIVGTLVFVGTNKLSPAGMREVLDSRDRGKAGPTAPAHGLFLLKVRYTGQTA